MNIFLYISLAIQFCQVEEAGINFFRKHLFGTGMKCWEQWNYMTNSYRIAPLAILIYSKSDDGNTNTTTASDDDAAAAAADDDDDDDALHQTDDILT